MAKSSIPSAEEALAGMAKKGRTPMNKEGIAFTAPSASPKAGKLVSKGGAQAADPSAQGVGVRGMAAASHTDRNGAQYSITSRYMRQTSPEAGATQANGRLFQSAVKRTNPNFSAGVATSM